MEKYSVKLSAICEKMKFEMVRKAADFDDTKIYTPIVNRPSIQLAGFFDMFDRERLQLMGMIETTYLERFPAEIIRAKFDKLMSHKIPALVICHDVRILPECMEIAEKYDITILKTKQDTSEVLTNLILYLKDCLAPRITRHGVFVEVYGEGLLLLGESGVGKSEAAVELIKRGHRLIADDAVEIKRTSSNTLIGTAPDLIRYYIELRGIGVVDVRRIFGSGSVKLNEKIDLVVHLETWQEGMNYDRMGSKEHYTDILGVDVPFLKIPIKPGRNLAVILEVAAMNNRQKKMGYNSAEELEAQINKHFEEQLKAQGNS